ncbi:MAG: transcriptional repressor [Rhodospirillales bacterium]|nr:transcriptional repressor [Rhodospirillales bacterium]
MARARVHELRPFKKEGHDHRRCVTAALDRAAKVCAAKGARLTAIRRRVLELVWQTHRPVGAYDILAALGRKRETVAPPTVYRALEFLRAHRLVHRIESLNAFIGCERPDEPHCGQFLICRACGRAAELADGRIEAAVRRGLAEANFALERPTVEALGLCPNCRPSAEAGNA